jgi:hypothetical protein
MIHYIEKGGSAIDPPSSFIGISIFAGDLLFLQASPQPFFFVGDFAMGLAGCAGVGAAFAGVPALQ